MRTLFRGRLAWFLALVDFDETFITRLRIIATLQGRHEAVILAHEVDDLFIRSIAKRAQNER